MDSLRTYPPCARGRRLLPHYLQREALQQTGPGANSFKKKDPFLENQD